MLTVEQRCDRSPIVVLRFVYYFLYFVFISMVYITLKIPIVVLLTKRTTMVK